MLKLTWTDLIIEDLEPDEAASLLAPWSFLVEGRVAPVFLNKFGSWFLRRPEGPVECVNVLTGSVETVAASYEMFSALMNTQAWQEEYLLSELVYELHELGKTPGPRECYAVAPHPLLMGGLPEDGVELRPEYIQVMSLRLWHSICRQVMGQSE